MQRPERQRGRHRAPESPKPKKDMATAGIVTAFVVAIFAGYIVIYWLIVDEIFVSALPTGVATYPQESFTPQYPSVPLSTVNIDKECGDFFDQDDAQKYYIAQGGPESDPDELDLDRDGLACENYNYIVTVTSEVNAK